MTTIKSYTDIEQSKALLEIGISPKSADMGYICENFVDEDTGEVVEVQRAVLGYIEDSIPCFTLSALLRVIPKRIKDYNVLRIDIDEKGFSLWYDEVGYGVNDKLPDITMECPVDACVDMIEKLHELRVL